MVFSANKKDLETNLETKIEMEIFNNGKSVIIKVGKPEIYHDNGKSYDYKYKNNNNELVSLQGYIYDFQSLNIDENGNVKSMKTNSVTRNSKILGTDSSEITDGFLHVELSEFDKNGVEVVNQSYELKNRQFGINRSNFSLAECVNGVDFIVRESIDVNRRELEKCDFKRNLTKKDLYLLSKDLFRRESLEHIYHYSTKKDYTGRLDSNEFYVLAKTPDLISKENPQFTNSEDFNKASEIFGLKGGLMFEIEQLKNSNPKEYHRMLEQVNSLYESFSDNQTFKK